MLNVNSTSKSYFQLIVFSFIELCLCQVTSDIAISVPIFLGHSMGPISYDQLSDCQFRYIFQEIIVLTICCGHCLRVNLYLHIAITTIANCTAPLISVRRWVITSLIRYNQLSDCQIIYIFYQILFLYKFVLAIASGSFCACIQV